MKKAIIAAVIIAATGVTALSLGEGFNSKPIIKTVKADQTELMQKGFSTPKNDVSSAD